MIVKKAFKFILILSILWMLFFFACMWSVYAYSKKYYDDTCDVIIVLGAGTDNGEISPIFEERMNHAISLMKEGTAKQLIITGGIGENQEISDSEIGKKYATNAGLPENKILIEEESHITFYNLMHAKILMEEHALETALIVSDPYHMRRAMSMCEDIGIQALPSPTPTSMFRTGKTKRSFLINQTWNYCLYILFGKFRSTSLNS